MLANIRPLREIRLIGASSQLISFLFALLLLLLLAPLVAPRQSLEELRQSSRLLLLLLMEPRSGGPLFPCSQLESAPLAANPS